MDPLGYVRLMDKILHDPKDPKLWELWYIPYYGSCRILSINRMKAEPEDLAFRFRFFSDWARGSWNSIWVLWYLPKMNLDSPQP